MTTTVTRESRGVHLSGLSAERRRGIPSAPFCLRELLSQRRRDFSFALRYVENVILLRFDEHQNRADLSKVHLLLQDAHQTS
jgi:hypothetical protein